MLSATVSCNTESFQLCDIFGGSVRTDGSTWISIGVTDKEDEFIPILVL